MDDVESLSCDVNVKINAMSVDNENDDVTKMTMNNADLDNLDAMIWTLTLQIMTFVIITMITLVFYYNYEKSSSARLECAQI